MTRRSTAFASLFVAASALALSACATLAPYGPQGGPNGQGFSEQRIESDRYRVTYRGVGAPEPVADRALLRAAQLTTEQGYDWFEVTQRYVDGRPDSAGGMRPSVSIGGGTSHYGGRYGGFSSSGVGVGVGLNFSGPSATSTLLEIRLGRGPKPEDREAYDARDVQRNLRPF
ncbi:hypothetical protein BH10PSE2_BH10PSE2_18490 [soil metagenome]